MNGARPTAVVALPKSGAMEFTLQSKLLDTGRAAVRLKARPDMWPLSVELTVEAHVYLHDADVVQALETHGRALSQAYKDERSALWRQVGPPDGGDEAELAVSWLAIANAAPQADYVATLTIRDGRGALLEAWPGSQNPTRVPGRIGPSGNPTDIGRIGITVG